MKKSFELRQEALDAMDQTYIDGWIAECAARETLGAYQYGLHLLETIQGGIHVDLGSGLGQFPASLKQQSPTTRVFGVESNMRMAALMYHSSKTQQVPLDVIVGTSLEDASGRKQYGVPEGIDVHRSLDPRAPLQLLVDDIRSLNVLKAILGDRLIDSGSFLFPGSGLRPVFEELETPEAIVLAQTNLAYRTVRSGNHINRVRSSAHHFFSERVKSGGMVVLAERSEQVPSDPEEAHPFIASGIFNLMGDASRYWQIEPAHIGYRGFSVEGHSSNLGWANAATGRVDTSSSRSGFLVIVGVTRNDLPYSTSN